jgi:LemA protein
MVFGYKPKPNFAVENAAQIQEAPDVDFNQSVPGQPAPQPQPAQPAPQPAPAG